MIDYAPLISILVTFLLIAFLVSSRMAIRIHDIPNERSLHDAPIPRIGGFGLVIGMLSGWVIAYKMLDWWVILPLLLLFIMSLLDDIHGLPVYKRLLVHFLAVAVFLVGANFWAQGIIIFSLLLIFSVWMINLYNFMDGSDGLAGGMAFLGFTTYGIALLLNHNEVQAILNFCISAAALGFLYYNVYPAKIFLGDAGSIPLGFMVTVMGILGWKSHAWPIWFPLLVFSPFIVDASVTLAKRIIRKSKVTEAHCEHYYQRMVQMGWGHKKTALVGYALMLACGASAVILLHQPRSWDLSILIAWAFIYIILIFCIDKLWLRHIKAKTNGEISGL